MDALDSVLALRPFVPSRDYDLSRRFYEALGFSTTYSDDRVTILKLGSVSFILQNFYVREVAENCVVQILVRDVEAWWARTDPATRLADFEVKPPIAPALQNWGLKVGFLFDPSGVLWHVAEAPF